MVTRSGWLVAIGSALTIGFGRILALTELYLLGSTGLALVVLSVLWVRRAVPELLVARTIAPDRVQHRGASRVDLRISNRGRRRSPVVTLHDPVTGTVGATVGLAPLHPGDHHAASYRLPTERRGLVHCGPVEGRLTDPFGLARRRFDLAGTATLTVLPAIEELGPRARRGGLDDPMAGAAHHVPGRTADEDFATLRPYVVGDDLRRVHWASTARTGDLLVRLDDPPWQGRHTVILDARSIDDEDRFERSVSAAASLVHAAAVRGDRVRLVLSNGTDTGTIDARAGRDTLLEHLALVEAEPSGRLRRVHAGSRLGSGAVALVTCTLDDSAIDLVADLDRTFTSTRVVLFTGPPAASGSAPLPAGIDVVTVAPGATLATAFPVGASGRGPTR